MRRLVDKVSEISPLSDGTKPHSGGDGDGDGYFGSSTLIILAALLCALICVLGLNSILRCAIRCGHRRLAFETPEGAAAATGLRKKALRQIPMTVYGPGAGITTTDCSICLREFEGGEKVRVLPRCGHGFHVKCIDTWLALQSSCPTCRRSLLLHQDNGAAVVVVDEPAN